MTKLWLLALLIPFSGLNAQVLSPKTDTTQQTVGRKDMSKRAPEQFMSGQIKHLSDFINRFNAIVDKNAETMRLLELFNEDDSRLSVTGRVHHAYGYQVNAFIQMVLTQHIRVPKRGAMYALIGLRVSCNGAPDTLKLHLRKDYTADSAAYWHIIKVIAPTRLADEKLNARKGRPTAERVELPPNASEVSFLPLLRGLDDYQSLAPFTHCEECRDAAWQKVDNALQNGRLTAEAVVSNRIYLTAGNWVMELSEFIREKDNSGWLISDLVEK